MKPNKIKLDFKKMETICLADIEDFKAMKDAEVIETKHGPLIYLNRGSNILAVAHLDSVQSTKHFYHVQIAKDDVVFNGQLDDRLGAYIIMDLLPSLGINTDILLTWGEEKGESTAEFFKTNKQYNWMVQFDRMGSDVVHYQYGDEPFKKTLRDIGFTGIQQGMNSDIAYLEHLGCKGFNVGIGYKDYHDAWARADMHVVRAQVGIFHEFYHKYKKKRFAHDPKPAGKPSNRVQTTTYNRDPEWWMHEKWNPVTRKYEKIKPEVPLLTAKEQTKKPGNGEATHKKSGKMMKVGDRCLMCNWELVPLLDDDTDTYGVCHTCDDKVQVCKGCNELEFKTEMRDGRCFKCLGTKRRLSQHACPRCKLRMYEDELGGDFCELCIQYPNDKWWEEGFNLETGAWDNITERIEAAEEQEENFPFEIQEEEEPENEEEVPWYLRGE